MMMMSTHNPNLATNEVDVTKVKQNLLSSLPSPAESFSRLKKKLEEEVKLIREIEDSGRSVVPQVQFSDIINGRVSAKEIEEIKKRGTVVVRGVVEESLVNKWAEEAERYVKVDNDYHNAAGGSETERAADTKNFFAESTPQIFGVYWNKGQVSARQHPNMQLAREFLNRLWSHQVPSKDTPGRWAFDPSKETTYADRQRIREPGNVSGLVPHIDGGSIERWSDPGYVKYYEQVFSGQWEHFDPWAGHLRVEAEELPSPNVCTLFRSFQGWLALSKQGKGDGTLTVVPLLKEAISHILLRPFETDVPSDDPLCGAFEGRQHKILPKWHGDVLNAMVSIPTVNPGDTVFWHPDLIHAVEKEHKGTGKSSVFYIGCAPLCEKNARYLKGQKQSFLIGQAGPDFPQEGKEVSFVNRATVDDLTELGKRQMGFLPWSVVDVKDEEQRKLIELSNAAMV